MNNCVKKWEPFLLYYGITWSIYNPVVIIVNIRFFNVAWNSHVLFAPIVDVAVSDVSIMNKSVVIFLNESYEQKSMTNQVNNWLMLPFGKMWYSCLMFLSIVFFSFRLFSILMSLLNSLFVWWLPIGRHVYDLFVFEVVFSLNFAEVWMLFLGSKWKSSLG